MKKSELKSIIKEELKKVLNEGTIRSFTSAKPESEFSGDTTAIKSAAKALLQSHKAELPNTDKYSFLYFPDFNWSDGRVQLGPSIGLRSGETFYIYSMGGKKRWERVTSSDGLLARFIANGRKEAYYIEF